LWLAGCGDKALVDPLADDTAIAKEGAGETPTATASGSTTPLTLAPSYSVERRVEADACNQQSTEGSTSQWTLTIEQDDGSLNARLQNETESKILFHGTAGASSFQLTGSDTIEDGDCIQQLALTLTGKLVDERARGDMEITTTYGSTCGVASGQSCIIVESFDSQ